VTPAYTIPASLPRASIKLPSFAHGTREYIGWRDKLDILRVHAEPTTFLQEVLASLDGNALGDVTPIYLELSRDRLLSSSFILDTLLEKLDRRWRGFFVINSDRCAMMRLRTPTNVADHPAFFNALQNRLSRMQDIAEPDRYAYLYNVLPEELKTAAGMNEIVTFKGLSTSLDKYLSQIIEAQATPHANVSILGNAGHVSVTSSAEPSETAEAVANIQAAVGRLQGMGKRYCHFCRGTEHTNPECFHRPENAGKAGAGKKGKWKGRNNNNTANGKTSARDVTLTARAASAVLPSGDDLPTTDPAIADLVGPPPHFYDCNLVAPGSDKAVATQAFLDNGSGTDLIDERFVREHGFPLEPSPVELRLQNINTDKLVPITHCVRLDLTLGNIVVRGVRFYVTNLQGLTLVLGRKFIANQKVVIDPTKGALAFTAIADNFVVYPNVERDAAGKVQVSGATVYHEDEIGNLLKEYSSKLFSESQ
jgi:hypothetical protein